MTMTETTTKTHPRVITHRAPSGASVSLCRAHTSAADAWIGASSCVSHRLHRGRCDECTRLGLGPEREMSAEWIAWASSVAID